MLTNGELIARVKNANKFVSDDDVISDRFIYDLLKAKASVLVKRELNLRKLLASDNVYQAYECICLIEAPGAECDLGCNIRRTKRNCLRLKKVFIPTLFRECLIHLILKNFFLLLFAILLITVDFVLRLLRSFIRYVTAIFMYLIPM